VLGVALGTILLPSLSRHASSKNIVNFSKILDWGIRLCLLLALPATIGLGLLARPLTMTLFMHGKFTLHDVTMTSYALIAYSVGLLGLILVKVLAPGFYANQDIKTPVKIAIFVLICTQIMNLIFIGPFKHAGLSLSIGLSACLNASCLCYFLIRKQLYQPQGNWGQFLLRLIIAVIIMSLAIEIALHYLPVNFAGVMWLRIVSLVVIIIIAAIAYFSALFALGFRVNDFSHKED
jgi:putative peptidoglycan lipid II flippase